MTQPSDHLAALARAAADLGPVIQPPGYAELLDWIARTTMEVTGAGAASIAVFHERTERLEFVAACGAAGDQIVGLDMDAGKGIAGWSIASGQSITIADAPNDPRFAADVAAQTGYTPQRVFAIPLEGARAPVGVMEILDAEEGRADALDESRMVASLAHQAAVAIETTMLFRNLGSVLFSAVARASTDGDLRSALEAVAEETRGPSRELAELLDLFNEVGKLGADERRAATELLYTFLLYAQGKQG